MKKILIFFSLLLLTLLSVPSYAQVPEEVLLNESLIRSELDRRGFEEVSIEEINKRLQEKGIDTNNLDPSQQPQVEKALAEILADLEKENKVEEVQTEAATEEAVEEVKEEVKQDIKEDIKDDVKEEVKEEVAAAQNLVYGQDLFLGLDMGAYTQNTDVRPSQKYILGEGDELIINIIGSKSQESASYVIKNGRIKPSRMESIFLKGLSLEQASRLLIRKFAKYYEFDAEDFKLSLNFSRNILVNVTGMARKYGSFQIPATNNIFTALVAANGPNAKGSVRNISLKRSGASSKNFDLYEYMLDPSISEDYNLENNDYIHIPVLGKVVSIEGAILRPHRYELKNNEQLKKLIEWAGGLESKAYKGNIQVLRYENDKEKLITVDFNELERSGRDFKLKNGDRITVPEIPATFRNYISIEGTVDLPGQYELTNGMKISDLLKKGVANNNSKLDEAYLFRYIDNNEQEPIKINLEEIAKNPNSPLNLTLRSRDRLKVFSLEEFKAQNRDVTIRGAVLNPNTYNYSENTKLSDIITMSGGLREDAMGVAYINRPKWDSPEKLEYIRINVEDAIKNPNGSSNITIKPNDNIVVFSHKDIKGEQGSVTIGGAVLNPNTYDYSSSMTLKDLLFLSGLKLSADDSKIDIYRINIESGETTETKEITIEVDEDLNVIGSETGNFLLEPFDVVYVRQTPDFALQQNVTISGEVRYPGPYSLIKPNEKLSDVIKRAGGFKEGAYEKGISLYRNRKNIGYLVIDVDDLLENPNSPSNYILKAGDEIHVPKEANFVIIKGNTNVSEIYNFSAVEDGKSIVGTSNRINVPYHKHKNAKYYVEEYAGGINRENGAKNKLITVLQPGGKVERTKNYFFFKKYPTVQKGATIVVGKQVKKKKSSHSNGKEKKDVDWGEIATNMVSQITAILTLVLLIQQIQ